MNRYFDGRLFGKYSLIPNIPMNYRKALGVKKCLSSNQKIRLSVPTMTIFLLHMIENIWILAKPI